MIYSAYPILPDRLHVLYHQQSEDDAEDAACSVRIEASHRFNEMASAPLTLLVPSGGAGSSSRSGSFSGATGGGVLQRHEVKEDPSLKRIEASFSQVQNSVDGLEKELQSLAGEFVCF